jgi:integrase
LNSNRRILLPQTKNGSSRVVYLNDMALTVLNSMPISSEARPNDRIFSDWTPGQVSTSFGRICVRLKISDFRFHDLRHTAASWMRMAGADIHTAAELLGHKDLSMARRYQHLSPAFLADAVGKLDAVFGSALWPKTGENGGERYQDVTANLALADGGDVGG